ncbi:MAG: serine hydrolase [Pseudomonadota bacterium]
MRRLVLAFCAATLLAGPTVARTDSAEDIQHRAQVAGYKASMTCSATFTAGQTLAEIQANELSGIYPDYRSVMATLPRAEIDDQAKTVSVRYDLEAPPRIAAWRPGLGCAQLPIGAGKDVASWLPSFESWDSPTGIDRSSAIAASTIVTLPVHLTEKLDMPVSLAFEDGAYGTGSQTSAILIVRKGEVVAERYGRGIDAETPQRTWSVAKSITATLLGAAANDGLIGPESTSLLESWRSGADPRGDVSLANLLHMSSGLESGLRESRNDEVYFGGARVIDKALTANLEAAPGMRFEYSNNDTLAALRALREAIGDDEAYLNYPYGEVLWKIGAMRTTLETDWNGDFVGSSQVWSTARDLARIGQLYLNNGQWAGEQILHPDWLEWVMTPAPAQPDSGFGYGGGFWLLRDVNGVPGDTFAAMGHRGQALVIVPSKELVIVRRAYDESGGRYFEIAAFVRDVVAAIDQADAEKEAAELAARLAEDPEEAALVAVERAFQEAEREAFRSARELSRQN